MEGWVGLVGWPIADALPMKWSHVNHGSGVNQGKSACYRPTFLPLSHAANRAYSDLAVQPSLCSPESRMCSPSCKISSAQERKIIKILVMSAATPPRPHQGILQCSSRRLIWIFVSLLLRYRGERSGDKGGKGRKRQEKREREGGERLCSSENSFEYSLA